MAEKKDLYAALGVSREASADEIRKAYRKLARQHHPDLNPGNKQAEERFKEISLANDVLSDAGKRKLYDEFGHAGLQGGFDPERAREYQRWQQTGGWSPGAESGGPVNFEDLFGDLGGLFSGGGRGRRGPARGSDVEAELELDLLDSIRGATQTLGLGTERLSVKIPAGVDEGSRIRLAGKGAPGRNGGPAGDLYAVVRLRPHPFLERKGLDLYLDLPVTVGEAALGARVAVPTPDGEVSLKVPPGSQSGQRLRLRNRGVKDARRGKRGDLYVRLLVHVPTDGGERARKAVDELEACYEKSPRENLRL